MSSVIRVENLGKKYTLRHQQREQYTAMRDVIADGFKSFARRLIHPFQFPTESGPSSEDFWALKDVTFDVKQGDRIGIIGRNGAGKSTLLKILSRITEPTTGRVRIKGRVASLLEVGTGFHPELTGRENIFLNGAILGMGRAEIRKKFDEIVDFAEIEKFLDTPVKRYSSGMYVRLAFAVAAHLEPEILIVDEVLAVGDAQFQKKCLGKMEDVSAKEGRTVLFVSHNMGAIRTLCNFSILISDGRLHISGSTEQIINAYYNNPGIGLKSDRIISERPQSAVAGKSFYIARAVISRLDCQEYKEIRFGDSISIRVDLSGCPTTRYSLEFYIYNEQGILVFVGASGPHHGQYFNPDIHSVNIEIGPLTLTSGMYSIKLSAAEGLSRVDTWDNAQEFTIIECLPFETSWNIPANREGICVVNNTFRPQSSEA